MTKYWSNEEYGLTVYNGDCLEIVPMLNERFDLILQDPPCGETSCKWDIELNLVALWNALKCVSKENTSYVFTASQPFTSKLVMSNPQWFKHEWIWDKHIPRGFQNAKYEPMNRHESVLVFCGGRVNYNPQMTKRDKPVTVKNYSKKNKTSSNDIGKYNDGAKSFTYTHKNPDTIIGGCWEANAGKIHTTQKPVSLMEYLLKTYTNTGDIVLDPFMGSGTTLVACHRLNRNCVGIEISEEYCEKATKRLENEIAQRRLFNYEKYGCVEE